MARSRPRLVGLIGVLVLLVPTVAVAQTLDDLEDAEGRAAAIDERLDAATQRYEDTWATLELTQVEIDDLRARAAELELEAAEMERQLGDRARSVYKHGSMVTMQTLLNSSSAQEAMERAGLLAVLQLRDGADIEDAYAARLRVDQARAFVAEREQELVTLVVRLEEDAAVLEAHLAAAEEDVARIREITDRQRRIDRGAQRGIYSCIFAPGAFRFRDTWGAARSGGRAHRGTDVFAARGAPVYAVTGGTVQRHSSSALGGIGLYLRGDDGNVYYYAHLDSIDPAGAVGARVEPGQQIARNGSTGNAPASAPHVHFEVHPGGGSAINPYPWLAAACY